MTYYTAAAKAYARIRDAIAADLKAAEADDNMTIGEINAHEAMVYAALTAAAKLLLQRFAAEVSDDDAFQARVDAMDALTARNMADAAHNTVLGDGIRDAARPAAIRATAEMIAGTYQPEYGWHNAI